MTFRYFYLAAIFTIMGFFLGCGTLKTAHENVIYYKLKEQGLAGKHYITLTYYPFPAHNNHSAMSIILEPVRSIRDNLNPELKLALGIEATSRIEYSIYERSREIIEQEILSVDWLNSELTMLDHHTATYDPVRGMIDRIVFDPPLEDSFRQHLKEMLEASGANVIEIEDPRHITLPQKAQASFILVLVIYHFSTEYIETGSLSQQLIAQGPVEYITDLSVGIYLLDPKTREIMVYKAYDARTAYDTAFYTNSIQERSKIEEKAINNTLNEAWTRLFDSIRTDAAFSPDNLAELKTFRTQ